jgi:predicted small secreted protein
MKPIFLSMVLALLPTLIGCNTLHGVGQDVQKAGQVIQDAAKKK